MTATLSPAAGWTIVQAAPPATPPAPRPLPAAAPPRPLRLLLVHPGHTFSTADVFAGLHEGLTELGHEVVSYHLEGRMMVAEKWLAFQDAEAPKADGAFAALPDREKAAQIYAEASKDVVIRALRHDVDAVVAVTGMCLHPDTLIMLGRAGVPTGLVLTESPYNDAEQARVAALVNVAWTNDRASVAPLRELSGNPDIFYLPSAYRRGLHTSRPHPDDAALPAHDAVFVGTGFRERVELLAAVDWSGIDLGLYGNWGSLAELGEAGERLRPYVRDGLVPNATAAGLYRRAKVGLNLYRPHPAAESLNPRAYELAACGCHAVTERRAEAAEVFARGGPAAFDGPAGLEAAVRAALADPEGRRDAALLAWQAVARHSFRARAEQLVRELLAVCGDGDDG